MSCCSLPPMRSSHSKAKMGCDAGARCIQKKASLHETSSLDLVHWENLGGAGGEGGGRGDRDGEHM